MRLTIRPFYMTHILTIQILVTVKLLKPIPRNKIETPITSFLLFVIISVILHGIFELVLNTGSASADSSLFCS